MDSVEANGTECFECQFINPDGEQGDDCEQCGADATGPVLIEPCPVMEAGQPEDGCHSESHHWGRHDHVTTVQQ